MKPTHELVRDFIRCFVVDFVKLDDGDSFEDDDDLFALGYLDSLGLVSLLMSMQERFGTAWPDGLTSYEDLTTVERIGSKFLALGTDA